MVKELRSRSATSKVNKSKVKQSLVEKNKPKPMTDAERFVDSDAKVDSDAIAHIDDKESGMSADIFPDVDVENPRTSMDNLGRLAVKHRDLGEDADEKWFADSEWDSGKEAIDALKERGAVVILPVYVFSHSGIRVSVKDFNDRWDSGQAGYIYATSDDIKKEYGADNAENRKKAEGVLKGEIETLDQYASGDVYGYKTYDHEGNEVDSVWGYYGDKDAKEAAIESMKSSAPEVKAKKSRQEFREREFKRMKRDYELGNKDGKELLDHLLNYGFPKGNEPKQE